MYHNVPQNFFSQLNSYFTKNKIGSISFLTAKEYAILFCLTFDYTIFKIVNQKSYIVNQFALGIKRLV
ncbi:MAG: hypothetical protein CVU08_15330, partial [Bacteroidetes bacterium HGW-Bacteroidetes-3]